MAVVIDSLVKKLVLLEEIDALQDHQSLEQLERELLHFQYLLDAQKLIQKEGDLSTQRWIERAMEVATGTEGLMENFLNRAYQKRRGWTCMNHVMALNDLIDRRKIDEKLVRLKKTVWLVNILLSSSLAQQDIRNFDAIGMVNYAIRELENPHPHSSEGGGGVVTTEEDGPAKSIVEELKRLLPLMEKMKEEEEGGSNCLNVKPFVWLWEKETRMIAEEAILTHLSHPQGISTRETEEEMERIKIRIQKIVQDIEQTLQVSLQLRKAQLTNQKKKKPQLTSGLYAQKKELVDQLISSEVHCSRIFIVGMAGVGKTTLAMLLYHNKRVTEHFDARAWVTLSGQCDYNDDPARSDLRQNIGSQLSMKKLNPGEEEESAAESRSKRYLIVLDNVWSTTVWNSLKFEEEGIPIPNGSTAKILITTRLIDLPYEASPAEGNYVHKMGLLSECESWELFKIFLRSPRLSPELEIRGQEIVTECGGFPPAIIEMGRQLSRVTNTDEWTSVPNSTFESQKGRPLYDTLDRIKVNLHLPLRCLFYFGLFPAKFEIPARRLIALWVAEEGLIPRNDKQTPEEIAEKYLKRLIDQDVVEVTKRNLTGKVKTCRLPEPVWKFCKSEAKKYNFFRITNGSSKCSTEQLTHRLADHLDNKDESHQHIHGKDANSFSYQNLVCFLSFDTRGGSQPGKEVKKFISRCISNGGFLLLLFLDLENVFRPDLPKEACKLTRLSYLGLRRTYLIELPSFIDKLLNLQTLDLKYTYIGTLPSSIWKMGQLRHLYLSEAYRSRFVRPPIWPLYRARYLTQLQTLWGAFIDERSPVIGGLNTLPDIRKLGLASRLMSPSQKQLMSSKLDAVADWIAKLGKLESLRLKSYDENGGPSDLHLVPFPRESKLSSIYLLGRLNHPRYRPEALENLFPKVLTEITLSASQLPIDPMKMLGKLEKLEILQLFHESYEGVEMRCSKEGFPRLQVLKLWKLDKLKVWHVEKGALTSLTDLEIRACTSLVELPEELPPKLQVLKLCELKKLEKWHMKEGALPSLTDLEIISCTRLPEFPNGLAPQLQVLKLCDLEELEVWHVEKGALPSLTNLEISSCTSSAALPKESAPKLQVLKLYNVEKLKKWQVEKGAFPSLTDLEIRSCTSLTELPEEFSPNLRVLKLSNLEKLKQWHVNKGALPRLTHFEIRSCTLWTMLPKGLQRVTTLKELKLSSMPEEFMNKIKDEESQAWYKIKPREHPEDNQIEEDMVLLPKRQR